MTYQEIEASVIQAIKPKLVVKLDQDIMSASLDQLDSLDMVEVVMEVEKKLNISLRDDYFDNFVYASSTVRNLVDLLFDIPGIGNGNKIQRDEKPEKGEQVIIYFKDGSNTKAYWDGIDWSLDNPNNLGDNETEKWPDIIVDFWLKIKGTTQNG